MIAILLGCGLRRAELAVLRKEDIQVRQGHWVIVDLVGKGNHVRTVPMPIWVKGAVDKWLTAASVQGGRVFRAVSRHGTAWGRGISENVVWYVVRSCAQRLELEHLAPHDLRQTLPNWQGQCLVSQVYSRQNIILKMHKVFAADKRKRRRNFLMCRSEVS
jgi:integrase